MNKPELVIAIKNVEPQTSPRQAFPTAYSIVKDNKRLKRVLADNYDVVEVPEGQFVNALNVPLNKSNSWRYSIPLERLSNTKTRERIHDFLREHPMVRAVVPDEKDRYESDHFVYEFTDITIKSEADRDSDIVEAFTKFTALEDAERNAVAIHFGVQAFDYDKQTLERTMISLSDGVLTSIDENREEFLNDVDKMFDTKKLNLSLAIAYDILRTDGEVYLIAGSPIGSVNSVNECLSTLRQNEPLYAQMKRDIVAAGKTPFADSDVEQMAKSVSEKPGAKKASAMSGGKFAAKAAK